MTDPLQYQQEFQAVTVEISDKAKSESPGKLLG